MLPERDTIFAAPSDLVDFAFDERVARVFPDMIRRSVPGYDNLIALLGVMGERFAQPDSRCYDLGCSLGAAALSVRRRVNCPGFRIVAVDSAPAMVERCRDHMSGEPGAPVEVICGDLCEVGIERASLVLLNFTLQFIPVEDREPLLSRIYGGLLPGGALILSEKLAFGDAAEQGLLTELHHGFKRANGYSDLEISQKRTALENVLIPETMASHEQRLKAVGFRQVHPWFQCLSFASLLALK